MDKKDTYMILDLDNPKVKGRKGKEALWVKIAKRGESIVEVTRDIPVRDLPLKQIYKLVKVHVQEGE